MYFLLFSLVRVPSNYIEEVGFLTYTAASHQVAIETMILLWGIRLVGQFYIQTIVRDATASVTYRGNEYYVTFIRKTYIISHHIQV